MAQMIHFHARPQAKDNDPPVIVERTEQVQRGATSSDKRIASASSFWPCCSCWLLSSSRAREDRNMWRESAISIRGLPAAGHLGEWRHKLLHGPGQSEFDPRGYGR